jgi:hypothetical protein
MMGPEATMRNALLTGLFLLTCAPQALAQELANSFDQLRVLVKAGDRLTVTDEAGQETRGRVVRIAGTSLEIDAEGVTRIFQQTRVTTIRQRHQDTLANGARIGFGIGAGFGALVGFAVANDLGASAGAVPAIMLVYGALGTGIGVGVDALVSTNRVIFSRPPTSSVQLRAAPLVGPTARGVRLTITW